MLVGAHVSAAGGVFEAPARAAEIGCEAYAIFCKNQRQWKAKPLVEADAARFRDAAASAGLDQCVVHDSYLINLGAPKKETWEKSRDAFRDEMRRCMALGVPYLNFHPGAHLKEGEEGCIERIAQTVAGLLDEEDPDGLMLLIENTAGQGTNVGYSWEHLASLLEQIDDGRMGVCVDTQHAYAAGHDLSTPEGYDAVFTAFDDIVGIDKIHAFHINDSKKPLGSRVDRHDQLGEGEIGWDTFGRLVNDPRFAGVPGILETPGGPERWAVEIAELKRLRGADAPDRAA